MPGGGVWAQRRLQQMQAAVPSAYGTGLGSAISSSNNPVRSTMTQATGLLGQQAQGLMSARPDQTAFFNAGKGELADFLARTAGVDARAAASRGLAGGEMELAQAGQRQAVAAQGNRDLLAASEARLSADRNAAIAQFLQSLGMLGGFATNQRNISAQNRAAWGQNIAAAIPKPPGSK